MLCGFFVFIISFMAVFYGMKGYLFILLFVFISLFVKSENELCQKSTEGTEFWFAFMESRNSHPNHYVEVTVTARETTSFTIKIGKEQTLFGTYTVNSNNSVQVEIPWELVEAIGSETVQNVGIHLESEKPINVYALNWDTNSADVAVIYPTESLGKEYFAMCYYPDIDVNNPITGNGKNSEFLIVASEDSTTVEITPSKVTDKLFPKDSTFSVVLNKGEVFQVQSENEVDSHTLGQGDLTGSYIQANKPIAFFSGSLSTRVPVGECCWDHLFEQIPPIQSWGREYYAVPLKSRQQDRYRIMAAQDSTIVYVTGRPAIMLNRGQFEEMVFFYDDPKRIYSDKPIIVAQFSQSRDVDRQFTGGNGDPFMIILSSTTQSKNDVTFVAYNSNQIQNYFVNIVTLTDEVSNIRFNGSAITNEFLPFPDSDYSYAQKAISPGTHRIENTKDDRGFLAYVYGYGGVESYGYGVGFNLDLVLDLGESINFNGDTLLLCQGETRTLDAGPYFDTYSWNTGDSTQKLTIKTGGKYYVKTTTIDGCELEDSIFVFMSTPKIELGIEHNEHCSPYEIQVTAEDGFDKYIWKNEFNELLAENQTIIANKTGEYRLTVYNEYNCPARDTFSLVVFSTPSPKIEGENLNCGIKSGELSVEISQAPENEWKYDESFTWYTNLPEKLLFSNTNHTSSSITTNEWGDYKIYYQVETLNGCVGRDTLDITFHPQPSSQFIFEDDAKCEGYSKKLLFKGEATDSAMFNWDLDGCKFVDTLGWQQYNVSVGAFLNKIPFIQLVINDNGCISDTTIKPLGAKPNFTMDADVTRGCDELTVNFSSRLLTDDNVIFEWEFNNGEKILQQNVTKFYPETGFYDVGLTITNPVTDCKNGFTLDSMIKVFPTPTAHITADPNFCYPDSANIFYTYNIDSSVCSWQFERMSQVGSGNDSITVFIEEPTGEVTLVVNEYGCISEPFSKILKRKPKFDFYVDNEEGCQPYHAEVFAEPLDSFLQFTWITDSLPYPEGNSNQYLFPDSVFYDVELEAYSSETGCEKRILKENWIKVHPKPYAEFWPDYPVALIENANITFSNYSSGAIFDYWDFGDGFTSQLHEPKHLFAELGDFNTQLVIESEFGCKDTTDFLIKILPFHVFTPNAFRPDSPIPENRIFMPLGTGADNSTFSMKIYDRWGQIVFESKSFEEPWDGTMLNGKPAPMGNYIWISHFFDIQGFEHNQKGQVLLIR